VTGEELPDLDSYVLGIADRDDGSGEVLILSVGLSPYDEQDRSLGMNTYCISTSDGATVYGGLISCVLRFDTLTLGFDAEAARTLGIPMDITLPLRIDPAAVYTLQAGLNRILERASNPVRITSYL
jgi:hypothetical protein